VNRVVKPMGAAQAEPVWVGQVLNFWFGTVGEKHWFEPSREVDERIRELFLALHEQLATRGSAEVATPREVLAAVVVLDQFSRNMFRGTSRAYAADPLARELASTALNQGVDLNLTVQEKQFLYLPFQHSEDAQDQARSLALFEKLGNKRWTEYALAHKRIIDRFGRFPHRNTILGRHSSAEEIAALQEPMGSF
jgi:uncharacterized protein (DUF924 family)